MGLAIGHENSEVKVLAENVTRVRNVGRRQKAAAAVQRRLLLCASTRRPGEAGPQEVAGGSVGWTFAGESA